MRPQVARRHGQIYSDSRPPGATAAGSLAGDDRTGPDEDGVLSDEAIRFERLLADGPARHAAEYLASADMRAAAPDDRPYLFLNMVSSLDGRAAIAGRTQGLGDRADLELMLELRAIADGVLVGSETLNVEGYGRLMKSPLRRERRSAAGLPGDPTAVVVSRSLDLRWDAGLFSAQEQPVLLYTSATGAVPETSAHVEVVRMDDVSPALVLGDLRARGIRALLCEGGPTLNASLLAADLVDELFLTLSPQLTGDATQPQIVAGPALDVPREAQLAWVLRHGEQLLLRYIIHR